MTRCVICGTDQPDDLCDPCWLAALAIRAEAQDAAITAGRTAEKEGRPVIYAHGRPYIDPDAAEDALR